MTVFIALHPGGEDARCTIDDDQAKDLRKAGWLVWVGTAADHCMVAGDMVPALTSRVWALVRQFDQHLVAA